jgi:rhodanese-related sulfurtransferase
MLMDTCTVSELNSALSSAAPPLLLDVRTAEELDIARIDGASHIPLSALPVRSGELEDYQDKEIVCMCHHGMRSAHAQQILLSQGFSKVRNLTGGIDSWAVEIDPAMTRY